jgi:dual specificity MAP kinase phosphatase
LRGITVVKADGNLAVSKLKGAIAPEEFLHRGADGDFLEVDPRDGFSVRNFQIQSAKSAMISDIIIYGDDAALVRKLGWQVANAQARWRLKHEKQGYSIPVYNTFICSTPFRTFERNHSELVAVDSDGQLSESVMDFFRQERVEMSSMTKASEISPNVWLGPTPDQNSEEEEQYDILIECSDLGRLNPPALRAIAEGSADGARHTYLDFPSSGSILPPTWSQAEADAILETCKWIWHLSQGTLPAKSDFEAEAEEDIIMAEASGDEAGPARKILIHCADGYTESTMLGIAFYSYSTGKSVPEAWLDLHTVKQRNFFAYPTDVALLNALAPRLLRESPVCADRSLSDITDMIRNEPKWFAGLDGSFPSRVLDYMYLGNLGHANNPELLAALGIGQILSVGETTMWKDGALEAWGEENVKLVQGVQDNGIDPLTDEFEECLEFIGKQTQPISTYLPRLPSDSRCH